LKIHLKELRETQNNLQILESANNLKKDLIITIKIKACKELTAIFTKSIDTAKTNMIKEKLKTQSKL